MIATIMGGNPKHCDLVAYQKLMKKQERTQLKRNSMFRLHFSRRWRLMVKVHYTCEKRNYYKVVTEQLEYDY